MFDPVIRRAPRGFFDESGQYPRMASPAVRELAPGDAEYPALLGELDRPPSRLYVIGRDLRDLGEFVAVIGARAATAYGIDVAARIAADLAANGYCVASGMARGADAAAHQGALSAGGNTVALLGCGVDVCYPSGSRALYAAIAERGAIISEHPPGTEVHKSYLKNRNRILVGVSRAVVVVQGGAESAAVSTGRLAVDCNRECFAVPGQIDWPMSAGVHALLRDGAALCSGAGDVMHALRGGSGSVAPRERFIPPHLPEPQRKVLAALEEGPASRELLVARTGLDVVEGARAIAALEIAGLVRRIGTLVHRGV